jgi:hypothetical protein
MTIGAIVPITIQITLCQSASRKPASSISRE